MDDGPGDGGTGDGECCRIEDAVVAPAGLVTTRALAPLPRLLPLAARLLMGERVCLLLKGRRWRRRLQRRAIGQ